MAFKHLIYGLWTDKDDDIEWESDPLESSEIFKRPHESITRYPIIEGESLIVTLLVEGLILDTYPDKFYTALLEIGADVRKAF